ncbi:helix-turn-helix domain-containing protein [Paenibacillus rhizoplanae]
MCPSTILISARRSRPIPGRASCCISKKVRIRHAKELLADNRVKLASVSESVGFENSKQFARVFKELEGISPGEYRAKLLMGRYPGQAEDKES